MDKLSNDPKVFWSGYGLRNSYSGIYHYGFHLACELNSRGIRPSVIGFGSVDSKLSAVTSQCRLPKKFFSPIYESKLIEPCFSYQAAVKASSNSRFIFHGLSNIDLPFFLKKETGKARFVITVHDLIPLIYPKSVSRSYHLQFKYLLPRVVERAEVIICVSEWTKRWLQQFCKSASSKIVVIPNGMELNPKCLDFSSANETKHIRLLAVGRVEPYKRFDRIIEVLNRYSDRCCFSVVTDADGKKFFYDYAEPYIDRGRLKIFTSLNDSELSSQYQNCDVLFHPSECEGFGLPVAEALGFAKPVVYQLGSGLDEVVSSSVGVGLEAGAQVDDWIDAIERSFSLSLDSGWERRLKDHFRTKNSWKDAANSLKSIYEQLLN